MKTILTTAALALALPAGAALADPYCNVPEGQAQPVSALIELADELGWSVTKFEIDHGCYELRVTDPGGTRLKLVIDPATLTVIQGRVEDWGGRARAIPAS